MDRRINMFHLKLEQASRGGLKPLINFLPPHSVRETAVLAVLEPSGNRGDKRRKSHNTCENSSHHRGGWLFEKSIAAWSVAVLRRFGFGALKAGTIEKGPPWIMGKETLPARSAPGCG